MTMDWKELLARLRRRETFPRGEGDSLRDEENAVEEGQHGPLRVITDRKGRKGRLPPSSSRGSLLMMAEWRTWPRD